MVVVMKPGTRQQDIDALVSRLKELDLDVGITNGVGCTILGLVGDTTAVDMDKISINPHVERVMRVHHGGLAVADGGGDQAEELGMAGNSLGHMENLRFFLKRALPFL